MKYFLVLLVATGLQLAAFSQQKDTVIIQPKDINTGVLKPGIHRWLVYFKMGKDSSRTRFNLWTRKIDLLQYQGKDAISITQEWENNDSIVHTTYSVCDKKDFTTFYHESWWKPTGKGVYDFLKKEAFIKDQRIDANDKDTNNVKRYTAFEAATGQYFLNWHLDLEIFPQLPYKQDRTFLINFYDPGFSAPKLVPYTVTGTGTVTGYDNQVVDCWLLEHTDRNNKEIFWISKKTKEVLKLEQQFGSRARYKIKLGFST